MLLIFPFGQFFRVNVYLVSHLEVDIRPFLNKILQFVVVPRLYIINIFFM
jgi:hypothetical protein